MVGILVLTHANIGEALMDTATEILGPVHAPTEVLGVNHDLELSELTQKVSQSIQSLERGQGVLILTDLFGATPYNVAQEIQGFKTEIVSGLNLNMLLSVLNYCENNTLKTLAQKAQEAGQSGIAHGKQKRT